MTHEILIAVPAADHVVRPNIFARGNKSADHAIVVVPGLHHEPFERRRPVDRGERHVDHFSGHDRYCVHIQHVRARIVFVVLRDEARVPRPHVLARDHQHSVGDRIGARARHPKRHRDRGNGDQRPCDRHIYHTIL